MIEKLQDELKDILRTFLNLKKKKKKKILKNSSELPQLLPLNLFGKIPNRKKISNEHFHLCEAEIPLDEIIKSINSETNQPPGNDGLKAEFYNTLQVNQILSF